MKDVDLNKVFHGYDIQKLNSVMNEKIKSNIPSEEIPTSLNVMKNNKPPWLDGFNAEFWIFQILLVRFMQIYWEVFPV